MVKLQQYPFFKSKPWFENSNSIWMLSTFELHRNLKTHFFPHQLDVDFMNKLSEMLGQVLSSSTLLKKTESFEAAKLTPQDKQLLYEYFLPRKDFSRFHSGERFILENNGHSYITLNIEDHLTFHRLETQGNLEETWTELLKLEHSLSESLEFAYSSKFGFITADHNKCGTGLLIQTFLHLPALIHLGLLDEKIQNIHSSFFEITSLGGSLESALGDLILISNRQTLGILEETLLKNMRKVTLELIMSEKKVRQNLSSKEKGTLRDLIGKSFGVLKHSSKLSLKESLTHLSLCKLGLELNWIEGLSLEEMNHLFFSVRKGYLGLTYPKSSGDELDQKRSEYIHKKGDKMKLKN